MAFPTLRGISREPGRVDFYEWKLFAPMTDANYSLSEAGKDNVRYSETLQKLEQMQREGSKASASTAAVFAAEKLEYVSGLAKQVTPSSMELEYAEEDYGALKYPIPKRINYSTIKVDYIDDDSGNVLTFHQQWFDAVRCYGPYSLTLLHLDLYDKTYTKQGSMYDVGYYKGRGIHALENLSKCSCMALFSKVVKNVSGDVRPYYSSFRSYPNDLKLEDTPEAKKSYTDLGLLGAQKPKYVFFRTRTDVFPRIYPVRINQNTYDKTNGEQITEISVEYLRIPEFTNDLSKNLGKQELSVRPPPTVGLMESIL
jgi:hypothetical protein